MSEQYANLLHATVATPIPEGACCGIRNSTIGFLAPLDLAAGDVVVVSISDGQPLGIYRDKHIIWRFEPSKVISGSITFTTTEEQQAALWAALGMVK